MIEGLEKYVGIQSEWDTACDVVEAVAHGYLLHGFLSPLANRRSDSYGGSLSKRMRFPLAVFRAVREVWPQEKPMGVRRSVQDWVAGGWTLDECVILGRQLAALGCDYLTASSGGISPQQKIPLGEGHQAEFAQRLRQGTKLPTMAVGMIYDPRFANDVILENKADFVAIARGMLHDPHWAWSAAATLGAEVEYPPQYIRAYRSEWLRRQRVSAWYGSQQPEVTRAR